MKPEESSFESEDTLPLRQLFQRSQPERKEVDIHAIVASVRANPSEHPKRSATVILHPWRMKMSLRAASLVACALVLLSLWNLPSLSSDQLVFAQVKERIDNVRTVEYIEISYDAVDHSAADDQPIGPTLDQAIAERKASLPKAEAKLAKDLEYELKLMEDLQTDKGTVLYVRRLRVKGKHLQRTDGIFPVGRNHVIRDAVSGMSVAFDDVGMRKEIQTKQVVIDRNGGQSQSDISKVSPSVDFFSQFTSVPGDAVEQLPSRVLDGKKVVGLRRSEELDGKTWTKTYWIDPETRLPAEIWTELRRGTKLTQHWVMKQFVYDRPLDDELFSMETPAGYTSAEGKFHSIGP